MVHAGDFTAPDVHGDIESLAGGNLTAVRGNIDPASIDLPSVATFRLGEVTFVVTHGTGSPHGYEERVAGVVLEEAGADGGVDAASVGIAGHTHGVLDTTRDGVRLLNPGSVTGARPATRATMLTIDVDGGTLDVTVHEAPE